MSHPLCDDACLMKSPFKTNRRSALKTLFISLAPLSTGVATSTGAVGVMGGVGANISYRIGEELSLIDPAQFPDWLKHWLRQPRIPVLEATTPDEGKYLEAIEGNARLSLSYFGGSRPGRHREFSPEYLFRHSEGDGHYLCGYCHTQQAHRILRADRISIHD